MYPSTQVSESASLIRGRGRNFGTGLAKRVSCSRNMTRQGRSSQISTYRGIDRVRTKVT